MSTERAAHGIACGYRNALLTVKVERSITIAVIPGLFRDPFSLVKTKTFSFDPLRGPPWPSVFSVVNRFVLEFYAEKGGLCPAQRKTEQPYLLSFELFLTGF